MPVRYYDWIAHYGRRTSEEMAAVDLASGRSLSYAQFDIRISRLAAHFRDRLGIKRGDRVAVLAMNTTDTLEVQFACGRLELVPACEHPSHGPRASVHRRRRRA